MGTPAEQVAKDAKRKAKAEAEAEAEA